jgi:hypothetical protein
MPAFEQTVRRTVLSLAMTDEASIRARPDAGKASIVRQLERRAACGLGFVPD